MESNRTAAADISNNIEGLRRGSVAVFTTDFLPYSQTFVYDEVRAHSRYEVDIFCKQRLNEEKFPFNRVSSPEGPFQRFLYKNLAYQPGFDAILSNKSHDLIHAHFGTGAVYALPFVKRHDYPLVVTFWGNDVGALIGPQRYKPTRWRYVHTAPRIMAQADLMLCVSQELCEHVSRLSGRPDAVKLYHQGVDLSLFEVTDRKNHDDDGLTKFILVGRFTEKKGHQYALAAFDKIIKDGRKAHLTFVGSGGLEKQCRQFVKERGLLDSVRFAGTLSQEQTAAELARADVALVPSVVARDQDREGSPTVIREAAACGLPVIGTYHAGIPEIIDDQKTGFLVPERDIDALSSAMMTLTDEKETRDSMGKAGRIKMETEFDLYEQVKVLERHYDSVL